MGIDQQLWEVRLQVMGFQAMDPTRRLGQGCPTRVLKDA